MRKREVLAIALGLWAALLGCAKKDNPIVGTWVVAKTGGIEFPANDALIPQQELVLKSDGTFSEHVEVHVMMDLVHDSKGTYRVEGQRLFLNGRMTGYADDGYKKEKIDDPIHVELTIKGDQLVLGSGDTEMVYIRKGTKLAPTKTKAYSSSESEDAKKIFSSSVKTYASLKTYRDTGSHKCLNGGFMSKVSRFSTRFERNGRFYFCTEALSNGKPYQADAVWFDGKKSRVYMGLDGATGERDVRNALSIIEPGSGEEASLIPDLLMGRSQLVDI